MISADAAAAELMEAVAAAFPDLAGKAFRLLSPGFDSVALEVDARLVFKFPRHDEARAALAREVSLLADIGPRVTLRVPDLELVESPRLFSRHHKIPGEHLFTREYQQLSEASKLDLAGKLAQFLAEMHALDPAMMKLAGAAPIKPWLPPEEILSGIDAQLFGSTRNWALRAFEAWRAMPPDPHGLTYGHFDGHGWNIAFDHNLERLNGIYDFADSGFGPLHQDFIYSSWISPDLTSRIIDAYEATTRRPIDRSRVRLLFIALQLSELVEFARERGPDVGRVAELASLAEAFPIP